MPTAPTTLLIGLLTLAVAFASIPYAFDNGQCTRRCRDVFQDGGRGGYLREPWPSPVAGAAASAGESAAAQAQPKRDVHGVWLLAARLAPVLSGFTRESWSAWNECACFERAGGGASGALELGTAPRLFDDVERGYPYVWRDSHVCASDGRVHASKHAARSAGAKPLHCGPDCGACSNERDLQRYRDIGADVSKVVGPCVFAYLALGEAADSLCMDGRAGFTPACSSCWVQDHGCLAAHCFRDCVLGGRKHYERLLGLVSGRDPASQTPAADACIDCMERFCSLPFIRSCGANRRSAGVVTDIVRDPREMCVLE